MKRSVVVVVVTVWPPPSAVDNDVGEDDGAKVEAEVEAERVVEPSSTMTEDEEILQTLGESRGDRAVSELCRSNSTMEERSRGRCFSRLICPKILGEILGGD